MTEQEIEDAVADILVAADLGWPILWPNKDFPAGTELPWVEVRYFGGESVNETISDNAAEEVTGGVSIHAVTAEGDTAATSAGNAMAQTIKPLFPRGRRIDVGGETLLIYRPTSIRKGYGAEGKWHTPVTVFYRTEA